MGQVFMHVIIRKDNGYLGISLAGHRDRTKMACFIAGINPKGMASSTPLEIGDEIVEVSGQISFSVVVNWTKQITWDFKYNDDYFVTTNKIQINFFTG